LANLSLAWLRDGAKKTYVQHRVCERGAEHWSWLEQGTRFYVCGTLLYQTPAEKFA